MVLSLCLGGQILAGQGETAKFSLEVESAIRAETPSDSEEGGYDPTPPAHVLVPYQEYHPSRTRA